MPYVTTVTTFARGRSRRFSGGLFAARVIAAVPLLGIGLMHVFNAETPMRPLVEEAGIPAAAAVAPVAVAAEIIAGASLLLGFFARIGAAMAVLVMAAAVYAHLAIGAWPNGDNEPPLALPIAVALCAAVVLWQGAGRWSLDAFSFRRTPGPETQPA